MITREDLVEQSATDFIRQGLVTLGYPPEKVNVREMFPTLDERATEMEVTQLAVGFNFDDGGEYIELGSDLTKRVYTIEYWTFGLTPEYGKNVAHVIRAIIERNGRLIPLKDIRQDGDPVIDQLIVQERRGIVVQRQIPQGESRPWDQNVWTTIVKVEDIYYPSDADEGT